MNRLIDTLILSSAFAGGSFLLGCGWGGAIKAVGMLMLR